jgi:uncharacterized protein YecE (DUF72 family)
MVKYGKICYYRLHGISGYRYKYTNEDLKNLAEKEIKKETFFMFNNVYMYEDAMAFKRLIEKKE